MRVLTQMELDILAPLYARRESLRREIQAVELGIASTAKALAGTNAPGVSITGTDDGQAFLAAPPEAPTGADSTQDGD